MDNMEDMLSAMQGIPGFCPFRALNWDGTCAASRLVQCRLLGVTSVAMEEKVRKDAAIPLDMEENPPGLYRLRQAKYQALKAFAAKCGEKQRTAWVCILHIWQQVEGYATERMHYGDLVFSDLTNTRFLVMDVSIPACPTAEQLTRDRADALYCMLTYLGYDPLYVGHCCWFGDDTEVPLEPMRLLGYKNGAQADEYMQTTPCSLQRHPNATCVKSHGLPVTLRLNGAVHAGNYKAILTRETLELIDTVLARDGTATAMITRFRQEVRSTREQLYEQVLVGQGPDGRRKGPQLPVRSDPLPNWCKACDKTSEELGIAQMFKCGRCKIATYCSKECQHAHWKQHKLVCVAPPPPPTPSS